MNMGEVDVVSRKPDTLVGNHAQYSFVTTGFDHAQAHRRPVLQLPANPLGGVVFQVAITGVA